MRVQSRSNLHRKRLCWKMMQDFVKVMARKKEVKLILKAHRTKKDREMTGKLFRIIKKVNMFERKWLF